MRTILLVAALTLSALAVISVPASACSLNDYIAGRVCTSGVNAYVNDVITLRIPERCWVSVGGECT